MTVQEKIKRIITIDGIGRPNKAKYLLEILEKNESINILLEELKKIADSKY